MPRTVHVVTDSTASLTDAVAQEWDITVVPLQVIMGAKDYAEGIDVFPADIAAALREFTPVNTSRPSPETFARAYAAAAESGASAVVSVHLSAEMSGTFDSATTAARGADVEVHCVDTRQVGMGTGFAALTAAALADAGAGAEEVATAARRRGEGSAAYFYVDTLEYLRRGGRVGAAAALVGSALAVKPLLGLRAGTITSLEKVRTSAKALSRLEDLAVANAEQAEYGVDVAVQHLGNEDRATSVAAHLIERLGLDDVPVSEVGAVIGAHVGPGMLAVTISPRLDED